MRANTEIMSFELEYKDLDKVIVMGDRVLLKPTNPENKTKSGLLLPATVQENEKLHTGYVVKVGPSYPIPAVSDADETWKNNSDEVKYVPLQPKVGDLAVYLQKSGFEIEINHEKYFLVSQSSILMLVRDNGLFE